MQIRDIMSAVALEIKQDATTSSQQLYVQIGAFRNLRNATKRWTAFTSPSFPTSRSKLERSIRKNLYRVQLRSITSANKAGPLLEKVVRLGFTSAHLINDKPDS